MGDRVLIAGAVLLYGLAAASAEIWPIQSPGPTDNCTCRAQGRDWKLGQAACFQTAEGPRLAVCDMVLNNTSWRQTGQSCPQAASSSSRRTG